MLVLTAAGSLPDAALARAEAAGGRLLRRLAPDAAELGGEVESAAAALAGLAVDANILPAAGRRKRLLVADMDSTIIGVECIDEIAAEAGVGAQVAAITERAMQGALDFEAALRERVALLAGLPEAALDRVCSTRVRLTPGARRLVQTMNALGAVTALVSGGFTWFTERVAAEAGFGVHRANTLIIENGRLTGAVAAPILGRAAKRETLEALAAEAGLSPRDAVAVGDGANDAEMLRAAGLGVAFRAKPALRSVADAVIDHADLTAVLSLQGIAEEERRG